MAIAEWTERELLDRIEAGGLREAVLFYTAMCGTCKVAERMLEIVEAAGVPIEICKLNINYAPVLREHWRVSSVPCLVLLEDGEPVRMEYAMVSVDHLYRILQ
ncbi:thioredoxin family protein [Paenibacillus xylaniclasticus]|uniref:thioredoxin family protein n=1 Tax=Paenibacillus xylaniclasticus TaxID=588083 RepID=UPI000FDB97C9|nr:MULTISPECIES: thioredoxin family protein [Paenibacillus]GFN31495.1 thiol reductase thioredoxin [Paenibacillus curdlanolyticus]